MHSAQAHLLTQQYTLLEGSMGMHSPDHGLPQGLKAAQPYSLRNNTVLQIAAMQFTVTVKMKGCRIYFQILNLTLK